MMFIPFAFIRKAVAAVSALISTFLYPSDIDTTYSGPISTSSIGDFMYVSFWAKIDSQGGTDYTHELVKIPHSSSNDYIRLYTDSSNNLKATFLTQQTYSGIISSGSISGLFDNWHHFVVGIDASSARAGKVYIDGVEVTSFSSTGATLSGITPNGVSKFFHAFKGQFANLEIWNSLLSPLDVTTLYNAGYTETPDTVLPTASLYRSFLTKPQYLTNSYSESLIPNGNFETGNFTNFTAVNGAQSNKWIVGTASKYSGSYAAYISNNSSLAQYNLSSVSIVHLYTNIVVPASGAFSINFRARIGGEKVGTTFYDFLQVQASTNLSTIPVAGSVWSPGSVIGSLTNLTSSNFVLYTMNNMTATPGSTVRLCFTWKNDSSLGTQPGAVIDDINISTPSVLKDTTNTYSLNIFGNPSQIDTSIPKYVQPQISGTIDNFESGNFTAQNWTTVESAGVNRWYVGTAAGAALKGTYGAYISNDSGTTAAYTTYNTVNSVSHFYKDITIPSGTRQIRFNVKSNGENNFDYISVFICPTSTTPVRDTIVTEFTLSKSIPGVNDPATQEIIDVAALAGTTVRLVVSFRCDMVSGAGGVMAVDDFLYYTY